MLNRARIIKALIYLIEYLSKPFRSILAKSRKRLQQALRKLNSQEFVFFTKEDNVAILNKVMMYIEENEATRRLKIVHIYAKNSDHEGLKRDIEVLDRAYPDIDIEYEEIEGHFGPAIIDELSQRWKIPKNFMFIGSPGNKFPYRVSELGGVRLIM